MEPNKDSNKVTCRMNDLALHRLNMHFIYMFKCGQQEKNYSTEGVSLYGRFLYLTLYFFLCVFVVMLCLLLFFVLFFFFWGGGGGWGEGR